MTGPAGLASRVAARIRSEPESLDQRIWYSQVDVPQYAVRVSHLQEAPDGCGTSACCAGWTVREALKSGMAVNPNDRVSDAAQSLLGLEPVRAGRLFSPQATQATVLGILDDIASRGEARRAGSRPAGQRQP